MDFRFNVVVEKGTEGFYAQCLELEGVNCYGDSLEDVMKKIHDAAHIYLIMQREEDRQKLLSKQIMTTVVDISI